MKQEALMKARAIYYNMFARFFVYSKDITGYLELVNIIRLLEENPLDENTKKALGSILEKLDSSSNIALVQEFDDIFHNPETKNIRTTASYYDEGVESGRKRVEMLQFLAKTKIRRNEDEYMEYEDTIGFIFAIMAELTDAVVNGEKEYENTQHCIFSQILNDFVDDFAKEVYEHERAVIFKDVIVVLKAFVAFERLFLEVSKPAMKEIEETKASCATPEISEEEAARRAKNKALKAQGPKPQLNEKDIAYDVESEI